MPGNRIVVVGTTADYVEMIRRRFPGRAVFLTDSAGDCQPVLDNQEIDEVRCDLSASDSALAALTDHLATYGMAPSGIACFDCESLGLAAFVAERLELPFVSSDAVAICRNKHATREAWLQAGLPCPRAQLVYTTSDAIAFQKSIRGPAVLKPLSGSGSELVFKCYGSEDCRRGFSILQDRLSVHADRRLYPGSSSRGMPVSPRKVFVVEEFVGGTEYSCDFTIDDDTVHLIRIAKKICSVGQPFGTTMAYVVPADLPSGIDRSRFLAQLHAAASSVGLKRAICMMDFIVNGDKVVMLEISPRPGGDCLPELLLWSGNFDIIRFTLDFAEGKTAKIPNESRWTTLVGLRLISNRSGVVAKLDLHSIKQDCRVLECGLKHGVGHKVSLPPSNYDSRILGHVIFRPRDLGAIESECIEIADKLNVEMEEELWIRPKAS